jgi:hypothetical protein
MKHLILCIVLFLALSSISFSFTPNQNTSEQIALLNDNDSYTVLREYHDGYWWLAYYTEDGLKVMEVIDPWQ